MYDVAKCVNQGITFFYRNTIPSCILLPAPYEAGVDYRSGRQSSAAAVSLKRSFPHVTRVSDISLLDKFSHRINSNGEDQSVVQSDMIQYR